MIFRPPVGTSINWSDGLTSGLIGCWLFGTPRVVNLAKPVWTAELSFNVGSGVISTCLLGPAIAFTATSASLGSLVPGANTPTGPCSIVLGYQKTDATLRASAAFGDDSGNAANAMSTHLPYSDGTVYWDYGGNDGSHRVSAGSLTFGADNWAFLTGAAGMQIWQNGILRATNAVNPTRGAGNNFVLGRGGVGDCDLAAYAYLYLWERQLSGPEVQSLHVNPYAFFVRPSRSWVTAPSVWQRLASFGDDVMVVDVRLVNAGTLVKGLRITNTTGHAVNVAVGDDDATNSDIYETGLVAAAIPFADAIDTPMMDTFLSTIGPV